MKRTVSVENVCFGEKALTPDISVLVKFHLLEIDFFGFGVSPNFLFGRTLGSVVSSFVFVALAISQPILYTVGHIDNH